MVNQNSSLTITPHRVAQVSFLLLLSIFTFFLWLFFSSCFLSCLPHTLNVHLLAYVSRTCQTIPPPSFVCVPILVCRFYNWSTGFNYLRFLPLCRFPDPTWRSLDACASRDRECVRRTLPSNNWWRYFFFFVFCDMFFTFLTTKLKWMILEKKILFSLYLSLPFPIYPSVYQRFFVPSFITGCAGGVMDSSSESEMFESLSKSLHSLTRK